MSDTFWVITEKDLMVFALQIIFGFIGTVIGIWLGNREWKRK